MQHPFLSLSLLKIQSFANTRNMSTEEDELSEDNIWRKAYEESFIKQKYNNSEEECKQRRDLLQLKKQVVEVQLRKEQLLEEEARFKTKAAEVYWSKVSIEYQIARLNHQQADHQQAEAKKKQKEDTADLEDLMEVALVKPKETVKLTPYTDSE